MVKRLLLLAVTLFIGVGACGGQPKPTKVLQATKALATASPYPTYTLAPTDTPFPTPTPDATPTSLVTWKSAPSLRLGEWAYWDGVAIAVTGYEVTDSCPGGGDGPARGAKLVWIWAEVRNVSDDVIQPPDFSLRHEGKWASPSGAWICKYDVQGTLQDACHSVKLYPDDTCEGRELFEVPERMNVEGTVVEVRASSPGDMSEVAEWRLD